MQPLVSILIPCYNAEKWLKQSIESSLAQTWSAKEIIIVDDGSTDSSFEIAKSYESKICKVVKKENKGASATRNFALSLAQGDFIQWLDADDILDQRKIEMQLVKEEDYLDFTVIHSSSFAIFYGNLNSAKLVKTDLYQNLEPVDYLLIHLKFGYYFPNSSWLVNRKLYDLAGYWNEELTYNDDGEFFCRVVSKSKLIKFHPESICYYRKGSYSSLSRSIQKNKKSLVSLNKSINLSCNYLLNLDSSMKAKDACIRALSFVSNLISNDYPELYSENLKRINELGGNLIPKYDSFRYKLLKKLFGKKVAEYIKGMLWKLNIKIKEYLDLF